MQPFCITPQSLQQWGAAAPSYSLFSPLHGETGALGGGGRDSISRGEASSLPCSNPQKTLPVWSPPGRKGRASCEQVLRREKSGSRLAPCHSWGWRRWTGAGGVGRRCPDLPGLVGNREPMVTGPVHTKERCPCQSLWRRCELPPPVPLSIPGQGTTAARLPGLLWESRGQPGAIGTFTPGLGRGSRREVPSTGAHAQRKMV